MDETVLWRCKGTIESSILYTGIKKNLNKGKTQFAVETTRSQLLNVIGFF